jgi:hypothetical protein
MDAAAYLYLGFYGFLFSYVMYMILSYTGLLDYFSRADNAIMASKGLLESSSLASMYVGKMAGYDYNFLHNGAGRITVFVLLDHDTALHIVGIGNKSGLGSKLSKLALRRHLRKLDLEGDFPKSFTMYCSKGREQELLELFDPEDMAFFADFCQKYDFELYNDCIYISKSGDVKEDEDKQTMVADSEVFIKRNQHWLSITKVGNS